MEWTGDVAAGDWIRDRLDDHWAGTMHDVVPRGFEAYARILHPATRERPVDRGWPADGDRDGWERFAADQPEVDTEAVTWAETAAAFGTTVHPLAQWHRLTGSDSPYGHGPARDRAGWRYDDPRTGQLEPETLARLSGVLAAHTSAPGDGFVAVWEGWGGLTGGMGYGPSRVLLTSAADADGQHRDFLAHAVRDVFNDAFRAPEWQPGVLSDEISHGARLRLPGRDHVLFRGGVSELADRGWPKRVPWRDPDHDFPPAESPSLIWPGDRVWVLVTEVDYDSTVVAGSRALVAALMADPGLETFALAEGAALGWSGDEVNR